MQVLYLPALLIPFPSAAWQFRTYLGGVERLNPAA